MGTDLFTSSRGPGLIGMLLALIVLGGFSLLAFFVFDERFQGGGPTLESVMEDDAEQLDKLRGQLASGQARLAATKPFKQIADELRMTTTRLAIAEDQRKELETEQDEAGAMLQDLAGQFDRYKSAYRESARASMVGREMDELKTLDGRIYEGVKVTAVDSVRMQVRHRGGIVGLGLETLPPDLQDYLQFDAGEKERQLAAEAALRERQRLEDTEAKTSHRSQQMQSRLAAMKSEHQSTVALWTRAEQAIPEFNQALAAKQLELSREESKSITGGISNAPQVRAELRRLQERMRAVREQSSALKAKATRLEREIADLERQIADLEQAPSNDSRGK